MLPSFYYIPGAMFKQKHESCSTSEKMSLTENIHVFQFSRTELLMMLKRKGGR